MPQQPEIMTERLLLRKIKETDWKMISYLRSDKSVNRFVKRANADTKEKADEHIIKTIQKINDGIIYHWCISIRENREMIGTICLWNFSEDKKTAELGYDLSPEFHKKGIMTEALKAVVSFGFNILNLNNIEAFTQKNNTPSKKLLKKNHFVWNKNRKDEDNELNIIYELGKHTFVQNF